MKRVVASYSAKSYNGRSWDELIMQLDRAGYEVDSAYRTHPHKSYLRQVIENIDHYRNSNYE